MIKVVYRESSFVLILVVMVTYEVDKVCRPYADTVGTCYHPVASAGD